MRRQRRWLAALVCAGLLLALIVSSAFIAHAAHHDCAGEDCPICALAELAARLRRSLRLALALAAALALPAASGRVQAGRGEACLSAGATLVGRKVRLND